MQHSKNADSVEMIKIQHFRPTSPIWNCLTAKWEQTFPANLLIVARYDYSKSQNVWINALKADVLSMLILPKSKWIFFLWIKRLIHIVQGNFWINPYDSVVDHWIKGWPYTPYILMRQSSSQNLHGQWLRELKGPCHIYTLKESSCFIYFSILHCPRRATTSVSAYYIRDCQRICFMVRISEKAPRVY